MYKSRKATALSLQKEQDVLDRANRIREIISGLETGKAKFKNITALSKHVASVLAKQEGSPCSPVTLRRNEVYRAQLEAFCKDGGVQKMSHRSDSEIISLQLKIRDLGIENRNIVEENKNLVSVIASLKESELLLEHQSILEAVDQVQLVGELYTDKEAQLYSIIMQLMKIADGIEIDSALGVVTDAVGEREVFNRSQIPGFFDWYSKETNS